jgi:hypothetical protein
VTPRHEIAAHVPGQIFSTPGGDPWMGLAPTGFKALPHDGVIQMQVD